MTIKQFIEKAIEGGWRNEGLRQRHSRELTLEDISKRNFTIFLDPEAWKAVGRTEGWSEDTGISRTTTKIYPSDGYGSKFRFHAPRWEFEMRGLIDALIDGKTIEQYLETL